MASPKGGSPKVPKTWGGDGEGSSASRKKIADDLKELHGFVDSAGDGEEEASPTAHDVFAASPLKLKRPASAATIRAAKAAAKRAAKEAAKTVGKAAMKRPACAESGSADKPKEVIVGEGEDLLQKSEGSVGEETLAIEYRDEMKSRRWKSLYDGGLLPQQVTDKYAELEAAGPGGVMHFLFATS